MDFPYSTPTTSAQETQELGARFADYLSRQKGTPRVVCLYGQLGSGKTTFAQGFARGLGVSERVVSPTFLWHRSYDLEDTGTFHHIDCYQVRDAPHMHESLGVREFFMDPSAFVLIEWADRIAQHLPNNRMDVTITETEHGREITMIRIYSYQPINQSTI